MILNYIFSISVIVMSAIGLVDIYILSNKKLEKIEQKFITDTKALLINKKGNLSIFFGLILLMLTALFTLLSLKMKSDYNYANYRKESYLCYRFLNINTENYINTVNKLNVAIDVALAAIFFTGTNTLWIAAKKALDSYHNFMILQFKNSKYCSTLDALTYFKNFPYKIKGPFMQLELSNEGTAQLKEKKWTSFILKKSNGFSKKKAFCLKRTWELENAYFAKPKFSDQEIGVLD